MPRIPLILSLLAAVALAPLAPGASKAVKPGKEKPAADEAPPTPASEAAVTVFKARQENKYASIRIPVMIVAKNDRLLAFAEGRKVGGDQGMNDIIVRLSDNAGKTWSAVDVVAASGEDTFNNPCPVYDSDTGDIFVLFERYPKGTTERNNKAKPGLKAGDNVVSHHVVVSHDNGRSWSKPVDITKTTKGADITLFAGGPNPGVRITRGSHKGRLAAPYNQSVGFGKWSMYVVYSDDHGKTWKMGDPAPGPLGWVNETALAETDKGGLYINARKWGGAGLRKVAWSASAGESWTKFEEDPDLVCTGTQGCVLKYSFADDKDAAGKSRMLYAGSTRGRNAGTVFLSYDDGKKWKYSKVVIPGAYAYSSMAKLPDGRVALLYEPGGDQEIRFTTFTLDWLTDGADGKQK